jgi:hypothetical protein
MAAERHGLLLTQAINDSRIKTHTLLIKPCAIGMAQTMGTVAAGRRTIAAAIPGIEDGATADDTDE